MTTGFAWFPVEAPWGQIAIPFARLRGHIIGGGADVQHGGGGGNPGQTPKTGWAPKPRQKGQIVKEVKEGKEVKEVK